MSDATINLKKYPWYDSHARAIRTVARYAGVNVELILKGLNPAIVGKNVSQPGAASRKKAA